MSERLTVAQLLPAMDAGGVERDTLDLARGLADAGHRSLVISGGGRLVEPLVAAGSEHVPWPVGRKSPLVLRWVPRLRRLLARESVDILHARSRLPAWLAWLAWRGMDAGGRPHFVTSVQGLHSVNRYSAIMTAGERVICVSETAKRYVLDSYPGVSEGRITVIPCGVDRAHWSPGYRPGEAWLARWRREHPELEGRRVLTLPGRLTRRKGHEAFIRLLARLAGAGREVHGLVVGPVPRKRRRYRDELRALARREGVDHRLGFTGARDDMREIYAVSDLVLALSDKPEAFGRTVLEALSLGRPVLGWDLGGVGEQLAGIYPEGAVIHGDLASLADRAERLLDRPPPVPADHPYTLDAMLEATLSMYRHLSRRPFSPESGLSRSNNG